MTQRTIDCALKVDSDLWMIFPKNKSPSSDVICHKGSFDFHPPPSREMGQPIPRWQKCVTYLQDMRKHFARGGGEIVQILISIKFKQSLRERKGIKTQMNSAGPVEGSFVWKCLSFCVLVTTELGFAVDMILKSQ